MCDPTCLLSLSASSEQKLARSPCTSPLQNAEGEEAEKGCLCIPGSFGQYCATYWPLSMVSRLLPLIARNVVYIDPTWEPLTNAALDIWFKYPYLKAKLFIKFSRGMKIKTKKKSKNPKAENLYPE